VYPSFLANFVRFDMKRNKRYTTLLIDLDDTILDTAANSHATLREIYHEYSFDKYYERYEDFYDVYSPHNLSLWKKYEYNLIGKHEIMSKRFYIPFLHMENISEDTALDINNEFMHRTALRKKLIDGAVELLQVLKPYYKMYVLSNGFEEVQYLKMKSTGLNRYFDGIILSDEIGRNKPDPAIFTYAMERADANPDEALMIGDNWSTDIEGAKNSGIDQLWFNPSGNVKNTFIPTFMVSELSEIKDILLSEN